VTGVGRLNELGSKKLREIRHESLRRGGGQSGSPVREKHRVPCINHVFIYLYAYLLQVEQ